MVYLQNTLLAGLAVLLVIAAIGDGRTRIIPNWLNLVIAVGGLAFGIASGLALWPGMAIQLGVAAITFGVFAAFFAFGAMGGGDVKLIGALALWFPWQTLIHMLLIMAIAGGILTAAILLVHRLRRDRHRIEVPYGIAIAFAGLWVIAERYFNHLA